MTTLESIGLIWPEIILIITAIAIYLGGTWPQFRAGQSLFAVGAIVIAGFALTRQVSGGGNILHGGYYHDVNGPVVLDALSLGCRWLALVAGLLLVLAGFGAGGRRLTSEYLGTLLLAVVGVMLVGSATNIVLLFLALELISIPTYVLLFLGRANRASGEATAKYFFLSILSSAIFLYGLSLLYGMGGSTSLIEISVRLKSQAGASEGLTQLAPLALVMITAGLAFKIAAVPLHFYAPDVYQGTTNTNAGLLAVLPKIAGIVALIRLVGFVVPSSGDFAWQLMLVLSVLTMTLGNVTALWQTNLRRMLAYSSVAHSGYMLIGLAAALAAREAGGSSDAGLAAMLMYLAVYVPATIGGFVVMAYLSDDRREFSTLNELAGLGRTKPLAAALMAVCMFSLTGIPPLAGFWGKLGLFSAALDTAWLTEGTTASLWFIALAIIGALNAAVSAGYYLKVIGTMYFQESQVAPTSAGPRPALASAIGSALLVIVIGLLPGLLIKASQGASRAAGQLTAAPVKIEVERIVRRPH